MACAHNVILEAKRRRKVKMVKKKEIISEAEWEAGISFSKKRSRARNDYKTILNYDKKVYKFFLNYGYQTGLTDHLDNLSGVNFSQELINKIILWKVNRYVSLNDETLQKLDELQTLRKDQHRKSKDILNKLLNTHGIDLAMASTILRFRNPDTFQIIDRHAFRAVYGEKYPLYPSTPNNRKIDLYFEYLDQLIDIAQKKNLDFKILDRLLYEFDKKLNGPL